MPAYRVALSPVQVRRFDVVGQDSSSEASFVGHVALSREDQLLQSGPEPVPVRHMRPPLERDGECVAHCVGAGSLTVDEQRQLGVFLDEVELEYQAQRVSSARSQYVISPHVASVTSDDGTVICRRYSCAGLIIEAYRAAGIDLVSTDPEELPLISLPLLKTQYPALAGFLDRERTRREYGIPGDGPWPVVLAGYVVNALDRTPEELRVTPYFAQTGDAYFPSRPEKEATSPE